MTSRSKPQRTRPLIDKVEGKLRAVPERDAPAAPPSAEEHQLIDREYIEDESGDEIAEIGEQRAVPDKSQRIPRSGMESPDEDAEFPARPREDKAG